jgi:hypothetical protein
VKSNRFFLPLFLAVLVCGSAHSNERRPNWELRKQIHARVEQERCARALTQTRGVPWGATRGATRGLDPDARLPVEIKELNDLFHQVLRAEFDLPYGRENDPKSHFFLKGDPHEAKAKEAVWKELGFTWDGEGAPTTSPNWTELARNYRKALEKRGIDPDSTFVPAVVLYRAVEGKPGDKPKKEYKFIDPLKEAFPEDMSQWKVLTKDVEFNIPAKDIFDAMKAGKFPLLDAVHDVSHFVAFLRFAEFGQTVRARMKDATPETFSRGFKRREYWLTEALSVPDPGGQAQNHKFLKSHDRSTEVRTVAKIEKELEKMSEAELIEYSLELARHFESQLRDVSGGNSSPAEKWFYLSESFGMSAEALMTENLTGARPIGAIMGLAKTYFENGPITLNANSKPMTNETATFSFSTFVTAQKLLARSLNGDAPMDGVSRKEALRNLVRFTSRTEHLMTKKPYTYEEWVDGFLQADLKPASPLGKTLQTIFGSDLIPRYYLGPGELREE